MNTCPVYSRKKVLVLVRNAIGDSDVLFIIDKTTDVLQRSVVNVLVSELDGEYHEPLLLMVENITQAINSAEMVRIMHHACLAFAHRGRKGSFDLDRAEFSPSLIYGAVNCSL